jgi:hypothetical protein
VANAWPDPDFRIALNGFCLGLISERDIRDELPWLEFRSMRRFSFVMFLETLFEIGGHAYVALTLWSETLDKISIIQTAGPPLLELGRAS